MTKASYFTLQNHISDFHHRLLGLAADSCFIKHDLATEVYVKWINKLLLDIEFTLFFATWPVRTFAGFYRANVL